LLFLISFFRVPDRKLSTGDNLVICPADGKVVVIDFKTDRELEDALDVYRRQIQIYAHAISSATGRPARAVLMKV